jgi:ABC-2 type transport system permease protein
MLQRLRAMLIKEFIQALRNPRMRVVLFVPPVVQLLIFGYAANTDIRNISLAIYDLDNSPESRDLVQRFSASGYFQNYRQAASPKDIRLWIDKGEISGALQINHGFAREMNQPTGTSVQVIVDGTDSNTSSVVMSYAQRIVAEYSRQILLERIRNRPPVARLLQPQSGEP